MKKLLLVLLLLGIPLLAVAQSPASSSSAIFTPADGQLHPGEAGLEYAVKEYLLDHFPQLDYDNSLATQCVQKSIVGRHFLFRQQLQGIPVYDAYIKVNLSLSHQILSIFPSIPDYTLNAKKLDLDVVFPALQFDDWKVMDSQKVVWLGEERPILAMRYRLFREQEGEMVEKVFDGSGRLLLQKDLVSYFGRRDSLMKVLALVFMPDPITTAHTTYGPPYADNRDSNVAELNAERRLVSLMLEAGDKPHLIKNQVVEFREMSPPATPAATFSGNKLFYSRGDSLFEEVNVIYHLTRFRAHINSLGFDSLLDRSIAVDAHAYNGAEQSSFLNFTDDPRLYFGTGGVDDAEDPDVVIHEYSHALIQYAAPETRSGSERQAIEEAVGDYFACSYSRSLEEYQWERIYNWDGHNEFWDGRYCTTSRIYPVDLGGDMYTDAELVVGALMDVWGDIGRENADKLMLASLYSFARNMKMSDFARIYLQNDSLLFNKKYGSDIKLHFVNRGFLEWGVGIEETQPLQQVLVNATDFTNGINLISFSSLNNKNYTLELLTVNGKILAQTKVQHATEYNWSVPAVAPGIYLIRISTATDQRVVKLVRY